MPHRLATITLLVRDYDQAIAYFVHTLGFSLIEDTDLGNNKRWVRVRPGGGGSGGGSGGGAGSDLLLARATTPEQLATVGNQTGGRVFLFLETDDCQRDYESLRARGVEFVRPPSKETYGTVAVFRDLCGNLWDLIQPATPPQPARHPINLDTFAARSIPLNEWNHRAHLTIACLLLLQYPLEEATDHMRRGVQAYNAANNIETTPTQGYHETLTVAWMRVLDSAIRNYGPAESPAALLDQHPHLGSKVLLRLFYSRPRIMSEQARREFVEPDLAPLPH